MDIVDKNWKGWLFHMSPYIIKSIISKYPTLEKIINSLFGSINDFIVYKDIINKEEEVIPIAQSSKSLSGKNIYSILADINITHSQYLGNKILLNDILRKSSNEDDKTFMIDFLHIMLYINKKNKFIESIFDDFKITDDDFKITDDDYNNIKIIDNIIETIQIEELSELSSDSIDNKSKELSELSFNDVWTGLSNTLYELDSNFSKPSKFESLDLSKRISPTHISEI